jgi:hypothetical protein
MCETNESHHDSAGQRLFQRAASPLSPAKSNRAFGQTYPHRSALRALSQRNRTICLAPFCSRKYSIGNDWGFQYPLRRRLKIRRCLSSSHYAPIVSVLPEDIFLCQSNRPANPCDSLKTTNPLAANTIEAVSDRPEIPRKTGDPDAQSSPFKSGRAPPSRIAPPLSITARTTT